MFPTRPGMVRRTPDLIRIGFLCGVICASSSDLGQCADTPAETRLEFASMVQPILSKACFDCHGPDHESPKAALRLDEASLLGRREGRTALVVPQQPDESELLRRIGSMDPMVRMPPESAGQALSADEIAVIRKWIEQQPHGKGNGTVRAAPKALPLRSTDIQSRPQTQRAAVEAPAVPATKAEKSQSVRKSLSSTRGASAASSSVWQTIDTITNSLPPIFAGRSSSRRPTDGVEYRMSDSNTAFWPITGGNSRASTSPAAAFQLVGEIASTAFRGIVPQPAEPDDKLQLTLPPVGYAVVGSPIGIDFDNIVLAENRADYRFVVSSPVGSSTETRWSLTAGAQEIGDHPWSVEIWKDESLVARKSMTWRVSPAGAGTRSSVSLMIVGDSLTHATEYPNDLARRLSAPGQPLWTMLGTHNTEWAMPRVVHEGYGGWTWDAFVNRYQPEAKGTLKNISPFVFAQNGPPQLDLARYFAELPTGGRPDYVFFLLGINDCFSINPDNLEAADAQIDRVFQSAETLLAAFRRAAPQAELAIGLTTPPNSRQEAFEANYGTRMTRKRWKQIQHHFVRRQIAQFQDREHENIFIVPTELNLDPVAGFPANNAVHPNTAGYEQIAASVHAWLTARWHVH